jgi:hypothetical protein
VTRTQSQENQQREDAARAERDRAPKDEDGYPIQRGVPLPFHPDLLPDGADQVNAG